MPIFRNVLFLVLCTFAVNGLKKLVKCDRMDICDQSKDAQFQVKDLRVRSRVGYNDGLYGTFVVPVELKEFKVTISLVRCLNKEALDTCIPFTTLNLINTCMFLEMKHAAWSAVLESFEPRLTCPIKAGVYTVTNAHLDIEHFNLFPVEDFYWKENLTLHVLDKYVTICLECKVIRYVN